MPSVWGQGTSRGHQCLAGGQKHTPRGNNPSRRLLPPTGAGMRTSGEGMEAAGVFPPSRDAPCSVLQAQPGRKDEEVTVWLTCAGWPLRQPRGHRVPLQRRLLRRQEPGVCQRGGHQGLGHQRAARVAELQRVLVGHWHRHGHGKVRSGHCGLNREQGVKGSQRRVPAAQHSC